MATTADALGIARENLPELPVRETITPRHQSDVTHLKEIMPPRRHGDDQDFNLNETLNVLALSSTAILKTIEAQAATKTANGNGEKRRQNWFMVSIAIITILGAGGNFVGSSGMFVGSKLEENRRLSEDFKTEKALREQMQARLDNLRTLYLIRFGEDPDKVTPESMNRRLQQSQGRQ